MMISNSFHRILISVLLLSLSCAGFARTYLVAVGVADYPGTSSDLALPANDANAIVEVYKSNSAPNDLTYVVLTNQQATKDRITRAISQVFAQAKKDDIVVFFFSGHGYNGGFCAYDGNIPYKQVRKAMAKSKSNNKMMFVDACHAGGVRQEASNAEHNPVPADMRNANVMLFLASRTDEYSLESRTMQCGFFTTYLTRGLRGSADTNSDNIVTARELFLYVNQGVADLSGNRQHPVMWGRFSNNMPVIKLR
ncbi:MAG: caspase domain-containing protein [Muribaculaceae bacterium]